jgi:hypothetical protein
LECASQATSVAWRFSNSTGVRQPSALWRRCRLWKISRYSMIALVAPWIAQRYRHAGRGDWTIDQVGDRPVLGVGDRAGLPVDLRRGKRSVRRAIRQDRANRVAALVLVEVVRRARSCTHRRSGQCAGLGSVYALVGGLTAGLVYGSASGLVVGLIGAVAAGLSGGLRDERVLSERRDPAVGSERPAAGLLAGLSAGSVGGLACGVVLG